MKISNQKELELYVKKHGLSVGGSLDLRGTQITSLPDGLSVGKSLDLRGTQITSLPDGLSVGWSLDLRGTQITSLPDGLSVGWYLGLDSGTYLFGGRRWVVENVDGLPTVLGRKKTIGDINVFKAAYFHVDAARRRPVFVAINGDHSAHGETVKEALEALDDVMYKTLKTLATDDLRVKIKQSGYVTVADFRAVTGACRSGINHFLVSAGVNTEEVEKLPLQTAFEVMKGNAFGDRFIDFMGSSA